MNRDTRLSGVGGILFAVSLVLGFTVFGPKGGQYSATEIDAFVAQGPTALIVSVYLLVLSIVGLIALMAHLSADWVPIGRQSRVTWGATLASGGAFLLGWGVYLAVPMAALAGGPAIDPAITYAILSGGMTVFFGAGGMLLGIALITLAAGGVAAPSWIRAFTCLVGLLSVSTWAFLLALEWSPNQWLPGPFYLIVLWGLVMGIWLLVSSPRIGVTDA
jgi:hypothetical protein